MNGKISKMRFIGVGIFFGILFLSLLIVFSVRVDHVVAETDVVTCVADSDGPNDEPGQKDLTQICMDQAQLDPIIIDWNWDVISMPGNNSADACALFDTDGDGFANYSFCNSWQSNQVQSAGYPVLYQCTDSRVDRCPGATAVPITFGSTCSIVPASDDPFPAGDSYPLDTKSVCTIFDADIGGIGVAAELLDVCSYPSTQPNSDPSDCVIVSQDKGNLEVIKDVNPDDPSTNWDITVTGNTPFTDTLTGDDTTGNMAVVAGSYTIVEAAGLNTSLIGYSTTWVCTNYAVDPIETVSGTGTTISSLSIAKGDIWKCTFTNSAQVDLAVTKSDDDMTKKVGDIYEYTIHVNYPGPGAKAYAVTVTDTLDPYIDYVDTIPYTISDLAGLGRTCTIPATTGGGTLSCDLKEMVAGETVTITFSVEVLDGVPLLGLIETGNCEQPNLLPADVCNQVSVSTTSTDTNPTNNYDEEPKDIGFPTSAEFAAFEAEALISTIRVGWETLNEVEILGFNLYRTTNPDGSGLTKLNQAIISADYSGSTVGGPYEFIDDQAEFGITYYYKLEVIYTSSIKWLDQVYATLYHHLYLPMTVK